VKKAGEQREHTEECREMGPKSFPAIALILILIFFVLLFTAPLGNHESIAQEIYLPVGGVAVIKAPRLRIRRPGWKNKERLESGGDL
jgi:hypothetical protein